MWPVQIEMCSKCKMHTKYWRLNWEKNVKYLINNFYIDNMPLLVFFYIELNKSYIISSVSFNFFNVLLANLILVCVSYYSFIGRAGLE